MTLTKIKTTLALTGMLMAGTAVWAHEGHEAEQPQQAAKNQPFWGASAQLGSGTVRTYVRLDKKNENAAKKIPMELGVEIPESVMNNLPAEPQALIINFPIQAKQMPFQYMMLDWNPKGHEPAGVYDLPHFDFHFYMQDLDEVMDIKPGDCSGLDCADFEKAMKPVPAAFTPEGYINVGSVVPYMGNHLIDPKSPEFNGQKFTSTWLYGAYDGKITFYEPMITKETLTGRPNYCETLKQPEEVSINGFYPKTYCTAYDADQKVYRVYLKDFQRRRAINPDWEF